MTCVRAASRRADRPGGGRGTSLLLGLMLLAGCEAAPEIAGAVPGGDPSRGPNAVRAHGCGTCHVIPEVPGANGTTGPPLRAYHRQSYVAGVLPNLPDALVDFIVDPQAVDPRSAMPDLDVPDRDARDIAAFLYAVGGEG